VSTNGAVIASISAAGNGWYRCSYKNNTIYGSFFILNFGTTAAQTIPGTSYVGGGEYVYIWGADLRPASQATGLIGPTYQRVVDAATYDAVGFLPYLQFDGLSWSMGTGSIDFTATDKMTVWAGVRKLSDAAGIIAELSATAANAGTFNVAANGIAANTYFFGANGSALGYYSPQIYTSPITNVLSSAYDIGASSLADEIKPRINGVLNQTNPTSPNVGTGNFGNYPLFIGARDNANLFFQGWLTSLIVRGAQSTQGQIEATESWVNGKTGAY
jgi:hypothetical protein